MLERNRHLTNLCNYEIGTLLLIAPPMLVMELGTLLFAFKSGWWREKLRSWAFFLKRSTWQYIIEHRLLIRSLRVRSDRDMLEHMTGVITAQETENPIMNFIVNPVMNAYFWALKQVVR